MTAKRSLILSGNMPVYEAQKLLDSVETAEIATPQDYIKHLAALSALFSDEVFCDSSALELNYVLSLKMSNQI